MGVTIRKYFHFKSLYRNNIQVTNFQTSAVRKYFHNEKKDNYGNMLSNTLLQCQYYCLSFTHLYVLYSARNGRCYLTHKCDTLLCVKVQQGKRNRKEKDHPTHIQTHAYKQPQIASTHFVLPPTTSQPTAPPQPDTHCCFIQCINTNVSNFPPA